MRLPDELTSVLNSVKQIGHPRLVGGCVRDWLLGLEPKDFDVEVLGVTFEDLHAVLAPFGSTDVVGRSFGVIKLRLNGNEYDFSLPRRESKTGAGHRGFKIAPECDLSDAAAAGRRDFTINSISFDPFSGTIIDPYGGKRDLQAGVLRHTSEAFAEDPLRVLRAFQLAGRFGLTLAPETTILCRSIKNTFHELPLERVWGEWSKWAEKSTKPSLGLAALEETGWLEHFPEIAALRGTSQDPEWHPEGDVFTHTQHCCDALVHLEAWKIADPLLRQRLLFAVLGHDFGKPSTTEYAERRGQIRWISPGHEAAGGPISDSFLERIGAPLAVIESVRPLVTNHLLHHGPTGFSDSAIRRLARRLAPSTIDDLCIVMRADHDGRPPIHSPDTLNRIDELRNRAQALAVRDTAPKPILLGRHLLQQGLRAGPMFSPIIDEAFEAQLDGAFNDEAGAISWLKNYLQSHRPDLGSHTSP